MTEGTGAGAYGATRAGRTAQRCRGCTIHHSGSYDQNQHHMRRMRTHQVWLVAARLFALEPGGRP